MALARSCLPDNLASFHSLIVDAHGVAAFGLGGNKQCCERAAYLAHAISAGHEKLPQSNSLIDAALSALCLRPDASRYDFTSEKLPQKNGSLSLYAAVWHVGGKSTYRGYFDDDKTTVSQRFRQLKGGPYAAALLDPTGDILELIGRYNKKHRVWSEMKAWYQQQLRGQVHDGPRLSQSQSRSGRRSAESNNGSKSGDNILACKRAKCGANLMQPCQGQSQDDVLITGLRYDLTQSTELVEVALEAIPKLARPLIKSEPTSSSDDVGAVAEVTVENEIRQTAKHDGSNALPAGSLNTDLLRDIIRSERPRFKQLDPAQDACATRRWAHLLRWYDITDLRFRNTHDEVSPEFRHGPHGGLLIVDLVDSFMSGEERPEGLSPMVAAAWRGDLYVVFGNRRLWALLEYVRRHGPWTDLVVPMVRVIVHEFPFTHIEQEDMRHAFQLKALDAMSSRSGGLQAMMKRRRR